MAQLASNSMHFLLKHTTNSSASSSIRQSNKSQAAQNQNNIEQTVEDEKESPLTTINALRDTKLGTFASLFVRSFVRSFVHRM
jgi:hypothetical protein